MTTTPQFLPGTSSRRVTVKSSTTTTSPRIRPGTITRAVDDGEEHGITVCNVNDFQRQAKMILDKPLYEYLSSGTGDEQTLIENQHAYRGWYIRPRVLRPVGDVTTAATLRFPNATRFQQQGMSMPLFVSPAGVHALCDPANGECATAKACGQANILFGLSQHATRSIEQVQSAAPDTNRWYQVYILKDRDMTARLLERAVKAGSQGIFLTVDSVRFGFREADARNGFDALPAPHRLANYDEERERQSLDSTYNARKHKSWDQNTELMFEQNVTWDDVRWIKSLPCCRGLPLVIKGIMTAEDAVLAVQAGADGIMVSNHGGRQQDGCLATIDALPEVVRAIKHTGVPILLDGGVRRGTDIFKALALGATAVGIGKPVFFALATGGQQAVTDMLRLFQKELEAVMALTGCRTVADITPNMVTRHPFSGRGTAEEPLLRSSL
jgi:isopentenyl diphosphate isomerase/L-lactate dehydrogenase-like FMN-dependent dehydrogenase